MSDFKLICGSPGCGKTTYLLNILGKELKHYDPDRVAYCSFTRTGSYEGRSRAMELFNYTIADLPYFKTLHSIGYAKDGTKKSDIFSYEDRIKFGKLIGYNFKQGFTSDLKANDSLYLFYIDAYRNNPALGKQIIDTNYLNIDDLMMIERSYNLFKKEFKKVDYTDLIERFVARNEPLPVDIAIIDEAQDLTTLQWKMIEIAFRNCKTIYIAGDDDQAIYEWSGADVKKFIGIKGEVKILDHSYRLPSEILNFSKGIANNIQNRIAKDFEPAFDGGLVRTLGPDLIDEFVNRRIRIDPKETYLFLSRNRYYLTLYKTALIKMGIPFKFDGEAFFKSEHIRAINIYSRAQKGRVISVTDTNFLKRYTFKGVTDFSKPWYDSLKFPSDRIEYYRMLIKNKADVENEPNVDVRTIHSVKGAEVDHVFLHLNITGAVHNNLIYNPDSEHRVFYVGATRAKKSLTLILPDQKRYYDIDFKWIRRHEVMNYGGRK